MMEKLKWHIPRRYELGKPVGILNTWWKLLLCLALGHGRILCGHCYDCGKRVIPEPED